MRSLNLYEISKFHIKLNRSACLNNLKVIVITEPILKTVLFRDIWTKEALKELIFCLDQIGNGYGLDVMDKNIINIYKI